MSLTQSQGEAIIAKVMRYMPPGFFDRLSKYYEEFTENELKSFKPMLETAKDCTAFYSNSIFWTYRHSNVHQD